MKQKLFALFAAVALLLGMSACTNEDNPAPEAEVTLMDALNDGTVVVLTFNLNGEDFYAAFIRVGDTYELLDYDKVAWTRGDEPALSEQDCDFSMEHDKANDLLKFYVKEKKTSDLVLTAIIDIKQSTVEVIPGNSQIKVTGFKMKVSDVEVTNLLKDVSENVTLGITSPAVGQIIGSDGKNYAADATLPTGVTKVAMIAYVNGSNGLAIQLNSSPVEKNWEEAKKSAEDLNTSTPIAGGTWRLPSKEDWQNMFVSCAVPGDASSASDMMDPIAGFKAKIAATGIKWSSGYYWSSTGSGLYAWYVLIYLDYSDALAYFYEFATSDKKYVLGCLAF